MNPLASSPLRLWSSVLFFILSFFIFQWGQRDGFFHNCFGPYIGNFQYNNSLPFGFPCKSIKKLELLYNYLTVKPALFETPASASESKS